MLKCVKKIKEIILSSSIFTGISYLNTFGKCCENKCGSGKGDKNITNNNNNKTPDQTPIKPIENPPIEDPNKKPEETPDPGKDPNDDKLKGDTLKKIKDTLKKFLNSVIKDNNNLEEDDRVEINITEAIIDSKKNKNDLILIENELNKINNQIIKKTAEINQEKAKEILRIGCIALLNNCEDLNNDLEYGKKIDLGITKEQIEDEKDIDNLNTYKNNLNAKKTEIEEIIDKLKENLVMECRDLNKELKKLIGNFYENKVVKTEYDDKINKDKTLQELNKIKSQLDYILKDNIFNDKTIGNDDYTYIYYDDIVEDLNIINNIYRIMNIFYRLLSNYLEYKYVLAKNKDEDKDPFTGEDTKWNRYVLLIINHILQQNDIFNEKLNLLIKVTDSNSLFSNFFKSYFYYHEKKSKCFDMKDFCSNIVKTILNFKDSDEKKNEKIKFLKENRIELGNKKEDNDLIPYIFITIKDLNDKVIKEADEILADRLNS